MRSTKASDRDVTYYYDFRMMTHTLTDGGGNILYTLTDQQLCQAMNDVVEVLKGFAYKVEELTKAFKAFAEAGVVDTEAYRKDFNRQQASRFVSEPGKRARDERTAVEAQYEMARLNNPGIGMQAIQDQLIERDIARYGS